MAKIKIHPELRRKGLMLKIFSIPSGSLWVKLLCMLTTLTRGKHGDDTHYEQVYISRADGTTLRICVYTPLTPVEDAPGLLWIHGGGYFLGAPEQDENDYIKRFINWGAGVVVAPDYTKSVVKPYPAALEDCYAALLWLKENGGKYGMRPDQIFVGGDSAGGGLTAALSFYARDRAEVDIAFQMPLYPMIDDRPTESNTGNNAPLWNSKTNKFGWRLYLGELYSTGNVPVYAAPARATDYSNLPPTCSFVGDIEPFYDETLAYMENLRKAGIETHFKVFEGCFHAFNMMCPKSSVAKEATALLETTFKYAVQNFYSKV